ncbi:nucleotidyltransferase domain-containing protein [Serratia rhizosphaerae]|uniref:Nucleotidyltransferase domain-containing protein n=1 Tax=Serratia rhizosphaerae TaxID=2597702 RepID=A0ABX6GU08_9GAMM|nr:nucleotidyltransferase domain-containing protein [Serratia rhizosphaerae]MEB6335629.1 nucleotidyltransferase domain-containing protein [Serratia rhizosphaerae]QHA89789.1 nucleotidyltransferase domain-containing protein [Serratia rhizosphaerae]
MMAVDHNGYIATLGAFSVQPEFTCVVDDAVRQLTETLDGVIHSIYVYGSVARGEAAVGTSDLDLCIIFHRPLLSVQNVTLASVRARLEKAHPVVSKVDFDCGILSEVLAAEYRHSWGYWLKHHCCCVYGADLAGQFPRFKPSRAIAVALNGDYINVLNDYIARIEHEGDVNQRARLRQSAAKKLIRATSLFRGERDSDWSDTLEEHAIRFIRQYPALTDEINHFLEQSKKTAGRDSEFIARLRTVMRQLAQLENEGDAQRSDMMHNN